MISHVLHPFIIKKVAGRQINQFNRFALAAFFLPLLLYWQTLAPTIYNLDSAELTTAVATKGIIRATGYPSIWSWVSSGLGCPGGDIGYRMNLFSAVCSATTIFLANQMLRRLSVGPWARVGALGLLATAPYFWPLSLIAKVYTLHTALMTAVILSLLWWDFAPDPRRLFLPVLLLALSMGNHAATILLVPGCLWFVAVRHPWSLINSTQLVGWTVQLYRS